MIWMHMSAYTNIIIDIAITTPAAVILMTCFQLSKCPKSDEGDLTVDLPL